MHIKNEQATEQHTFFEVSSYKAFGDAGDTPINLPVGHRYQVFKDLLSWEPGSVSARPNYDVFGLKSNFSALNVIRMG